MTLTTLHSCTQPAGSAALAETIVICPSSAPEIVPSAPLTSGWGTVNPVLTDRLCVCTGAVPPTPSSASRSGDLGPSLLHRFASRQPTLGVTPSGAVGAAPTAATCPAPLGKWRTLAPPEFVGTWEQPLPTLLVFLSAPRDAVCGQLQCQWRGSQPLLGSVQDLFSEVLQANGRQLNCSWAHLDLGNDVAQPLLALPGTACGPGLVSNLGG